jgi:type I restriction enzyme S subunit
VTWETVPLGQEIDDVAVGFASSDDLTEGTFQIRMNNLTRDSQWDWSRRRRVAPTSKQLSAAVRTGDVIFNATNSPELVGKSGLMPALDEPAVISNHFMRLRPSSSLHNSYLAHWLRLQFEQGVFRARAKAWINQATVSREALLGLRIPLPPPPEQRRIAAILDQAESIRRLRTQQRHQIDELRRARIDGISADSVEFRQLGELIDPARPLTYGILMPGPEVEGGVPYIRVADMDGIGIREHNVRRTSIAISEKYRRSILAPGDLLMSIRGHVGRFAFIPESLAGANITQDSARIAITGANPIFVRAWLEGATAQHWMSRHTKGVAVRGINLGDLRRLPIPMLAAREQIEIAADLNQISAMRAMTVASSDMCTNLFASLQHRAFRGEL